MKMEKVKSWVRSKRMAITAVVMSLAFAMMCCAGAVDGPAASSFDLATTMETSVQTIVNNLLAMIAKVMPITVTLLGAAIGITYGITFIKQILGKSKGN